MFFFGGSSRLRNAAWFSLFALITLLSSVQSWAAPAPELKPQTILFTAPASPVGYSPGLTVNLIAKGGASGNPVVFSIDPASTATGSITGNVLSVTSEGVLVIDANEAGNTTYLFAPQVQRKISVIAPATLTPAVAFGAVVIDASLTKTATLTNNQATGLTLSSISAPAPYWWFLRLRAIARPRLQCLRCRVARFTSSFSRRRWAPCRLPS